MNNFIWVILLCPVFLHAQEKGIFENKLNWEEILQKAKNEHKYVFVDGYTSWCGPCKQMDRLVYVNDTVGAFINKDFIAVKIQMDTTIHDSEAIRQWYATAHELEQRYQIGAFPTLLFFSPDGQAVHKAVGARDPAGFLTVARAAMDPSQQYYTLLSHYEQGDKNYAIMPALVKSANNLGEDKMASRIAMDYMDNFLENLPDEKIWTVDNINFIGAYGKVLHSKDKIFRRYFKDKKGINAIMNDPGFADRLVNSVVYNDEVKPMVKAGIKDNSEPDWRQMHRTIKDEYGLTYAEKNILIGKVEFYRDTKMWAQYAKYFVLQINRANVQNWTAGDMTSLILNNDAFEVFKYSSNKKELETALTWIDKAMSMDDKADPNEMDTKANILYKLGRKNEGLAMEAQSMRLAPQDQEIREAYEKMKNGQPTWPVE